MIGKSFANVDLHLLGSHWKVKLQTWIEARAHLMNLHHLGLLAGGLGGRIRHSYLPHSNRAAQKRATP